MDWKSATQIHPIWNTLLCIYKSCADGFSRASMGQVSPLLNSWLTITFTFVFSLWHPENSYLKCVKCFLPMTTAMAPSANPKTRIRGATNNFPAGKQKANHLENLKLKPRYKFSNAFKYHRVYFSGVIIIKAIFLWKCIRCRTNM